MCLGARRELDKKAAEVMSCGEQKAVTVCDKVIPWSRVMRIQRSRGEADDE